MDFEEFSSKVVNQRSFQLLQEYLNAAKGFSSPEQHSYHFIFYLHGDTTSEKLEKVEVSLPCPQVRFLSPNRATILPATRAALGNLLFACGLSRHVKGGLTDEEDSLRISDLLQQASEIQRHNETSLLGMEQKLVVVKNAMCIGRGVRVSFCSALAGLTLKQQLALLHTLGKAFDLCKEIKLLGHSVLIGDRYGVDNLGNLWLNHEDNEEKWSAFLSAADLVTALKYKREATLRRAKELKVAKLMEIEMIFTHDSLSIHPRYLRFLNEIAESALQHGAVGGGKFYELPVKVIGSPNELGCYEGEKKCSMTTFEVDDTMGFVAVPVWENLTNMYSFIEQHGEKALESRQRFKQLEERLEEMKKKTRKLLKLRHLTFDKGLSRDKCLSACTRLSRSARELTRYTEGLSICLSHENQLPEPGSKRPLCLKWDFSISEL
ncbi:hypothetical protein SUGI_0983510 [Cryptomeria japonica]|uniref:uncharacterized protein LOC131069369 isoform X2 n=1 Tax=Cryptomeria japonica TaxID=3369 RepID=UPI002414A693|nr:uncharacterized protein LOC131069369 isoform X2 [Cryptomeria japonica]GLJ46661.1 hypothetical protein SUGI_0983510 [Cryptomeria japonica]